VGETDPVGLDQPAYRRRPVVITSGTLYPVSAWESLGGFREDYFVDYVDIEYCLRARARGFDVVQSTGPCLIHRIGHPAPRRALGRLMTPTNHDASRRYYITRNRISVWRGYVRSDRRYVLHDMRQFAREGMMVLLAESDRVAKTWAILRGIRDGVRGRLGSARIASKRR
jgi:rhamnosyltransferase